MKPLNGVPLARRCGRVFLLGAMAAGQATAHDWRWPAGMLAAGPGGAPSSAIAPAIAAPFAKFAPDVMTRWDEHFLYVESRGIPNHEMMTGIRSWQQQVPLPQPYTRGNAWRIPLRPMLAPQPVSARHSLFRGAIALAVNGVPIFNALNNRGEDAFLAGELDHWGGHAGRGDDYHYHVAPLHLQQQAGPGQPIAFALDGFPIYGLAEPDGSPVTKLDEFNGHLDAAGRYHYHATKTYPYINGGLRGVVEVRGGQVEPQPRDQPVRPAMPPLRGALVTGFKATGTNGYSLQYRLNARTNSVNYHWDDHGRYTFEFVEGDGAKRKESYTRPAGR